MAGSPERPVSAYLAGVYAAAYDTAEIADIYAQAALPPSRLASMNAVRRERLEAAWSAAVARAAAEDQAEREAEEEWDEWQDYGSATSAYRSWLEGRTDQRKIVSLLDVAALWNDLQLTSRSGNQTGSGIPTSGWLEDPSKPGLPLRAYETDLTDPAAANADAATLAQRAAARWSRALQTVRSIEEGSSERVNEWDEWRYSGGAQDPQFLQWRLQRRRLLRDESVPVGQTCAPGSPRLPKGEALRRDNRRVMLLLEPPRPSDCVVAMRIAYRIPFLIPGRPPTPGTRGNARQETVDGPVANCPDAEPGEQFSYETRPTGETRTTTTSETQCDFVTGGTPGTPGTPEIPAIPERPAIAPYTRTDTYSGAVCPAPEAGETLESSTVNRPPAPVRTDVYPGSVCPAPRTGETLTSTTPVPSGSPGRREGVYEGDTCPAPGPGEALLSSTPIPAVAGTDTTFCDYVIPDVPAVDPVPGSPERAATYRPRTTTGPRRCSQRLRATDVLLSETKKESATDPTCTYHLSPSIGPDRYATTEIPCEDPNAGTTFEQGVTLTTRRRCLAIPQIEEDDPWWIQLIDAIGQQATGGGAGAVVITVTDKLCPPLPTRTPVNANLAVVFNSLFFNLNSNSFGGGVRKEAPAWERENGLPAIGFKMTDAVGDEYLADHDNDIDQALAAFYADNGHTFNPNVAPLSDLLERISPRGQRRLYKVTANALNFGASRAEISVEYDCWFVSVAFPERTITRTVKGTFPLSQILLSLCPPARGFISDTAPGIPAGHQSLETLLSITHGPALTEYECRFNEQVTPLIPAEPDTPGRPAIPGRSWTERRPGDVACPPEVRAGVTRRLVSTPGTPEMVGCVYSTPSETGASVECEYTGVTPDPTVECEYSHPGAPRQPGRDRVPAVPPTEGTPGTVRDGGKVAGDESNCPAPRPGETLRPNTTTSTSTEPTGEVVTECRYEEPGTLGTGGTPDRIELATLASIILPYTGSNAEFEAIVAGSSIYNQGAGFASIRWINTAGTLSQSAELPIDGFIQARYGQPVWMDRATTDDTDDSARQRQIGVAVAYSRTVHRGIGSVTVTIAENAATSPWTSTAALTTDTPYAFINVPGDVRGRGNTFAVVYSLPDGTVLEDYRLAAAPRVFPTRFAGIPARSPGP